MNSATQLDMARARHGAYSLLSRLYMEGVSAELLPFLNEIPELAVDSFDADQAAADHQTLFRFTLFPHASLFLDTSGLLGGDVSEQAARFYTQVGIPVPEEPDAIGNLLALNGFLCAAEAEALEDDLPLVATRIRARQQRVLIESQLRWLPPLIVAIKQQGNQFYAAVADLTWALIGAHFADLNHRSLTEATSWSLPSPPVLLSQEATGLKDIALYVTTPALSGWWFGRGEVARIGRKTDLPRGFGGRINMLMNLFRAASQFDAAESLFGGLAQLGTDWITAYEALAATEPALAPYVSVWQERVAHTTTLLTTMRATVVNANASD